MAKPRSSIELLQAVAKPLPSDRYAVYGKLNTLSIAAITEEVRNSIAGARTPVRERLAQAIIELVGNALDNGSDERGFTPRNDDRRATYRLPVSVAVGKDDAGYYVRTRNLVETEVGRRMVERVRELAAMRSDTLEDRFWRRYNAPPAKDDDEPGLLGMLMLARMAAADEDGARMLSATVNAVDGGCAALEIITHVQD